MESNDGAHLRVAFGSEVYDDWIATDYPGIQLRNRALPSAAVLIELNACEFMSPLPMLAMAAELMTHSPEGRRIRIDLGAGELAQLPTTKPARESSCRFMASWLHSCPGRTWWLSISTTTTRNTGQAARYIRRALRRLLALFPDAIDVGLDP